MEKLDFTKVTTLGEFCTLLNNHMRPEDTLAPLALQEALSKFDNDLIAFATSNCALNAYTSALRQKSGYKATAETFVLNRDAAQKLFDLTMPLNANRDVKFHIDTDGDQFMWASPWGHVCDSAVEYAAVMSTFDFETDEATISFNDEHYPDREAEVIAFVDDLKTLGLSNNEAIAIFLNELHYRTDKEDDIKPEDVFPAALTKIHDQYRIVSLAA